jgi:hypothetical protein
LAKRFFKLKFLFQLQVGKLFYGIDVKIEIVSQRVEMEMTHVTFRLKFENHEYLKAKSSTFSDKDRKSDTMPPVKSDIILELFPFHLIFKRNMQIISVGDNLKLAIKHCKGEAMQDIFNLIRPYIEFSWDYIVQHTNNVFEVTTIEPVKRTETPLADGETKSNRAYSVYYTM